MSATINIDPISAQKLNKRFKVLGKAYPAEMWEACIKILFDMKAIAQRKITAERHIVTSRLKNSLFVKTRGQKKARRAGNQVMYSENRNVPFNADLKVHLDKHEGAVGTNVEYAHKIERMDSFVAYSSTKVNVRKRFKQAAEKANRKIK